MCTKVPDVACIFFKFMSLHIYIKYKTWISSAYKYDKYAKTWICTPLCWWCLAAAASGRGSDSDGCQCDSSQAEAILQWHPLWQRLWRLVSSQHWTKMIRRTCSSLTRRSCACTDTPLRTTGYYPGISWLIPVYLVISLVNPWFQKLSRFQVDSGASKRSLSHETCRRREAARREDEWNVWHEYLWRDIPG